MPFKEKSQNKASQITSIKVWDIAVRLFHWSLVLLTGICAYTGFFGPEWQLNIHILAGYGIGVLILFRFVWGIIGSHYARFSNFRFSFRTLIDHTQGILKGNGGGYIGHNPAGALMVFALLMTLAALTITGIIVQGGQENQGMLAALINYKTAITARQVHEILFFILLAMIIGHLAGVMLESLLSKVNLVRAMVTGRKELNFPALPITYEPKEIRSRASISFLLILSLSGTAFWFLTRLPPSGFLNIEKNTAWIRECGDCHHAHHPSLLPAASWQKIMQGLNDHFGENASLSKKTATNITQYLTQYASERWDSEAANELRLVNKQKPLQITASPYWLLRHKAISPDIFKRKNIHSKGNCIACHRDATTGHFADEEIAIPDK